MIRSLIAFLCSLTPSLCGILRAIYVSHCKDDAQRGGAVGTAFSLAFIFISGNYGMRLYQAIKKEEKKSNDPPTLEEVSTDFHSFRDAIETDEAEKRSNNVWFGLATALSTLVWGFGDVIVRDHIVNPHCR